MEKERFSLDKKSLEKIGTGACIAIGGALLTYIAMVAGKYDFGIWTPFVGAFAAVLVNVGRKYLTRYE